MLVAIARKDGGVSILTLGEGAIAEEEIQKWRDSSTGEYVSHASIVAVPPDRTFRNAWALAGETVEVDMPKARELHKDTLRQLRAPLLAALDVEYQRADETGDAARKQEIALEKKSLRDVTDDTAILAAKTPEQLKAVVPDVLREKAPR